MTYEKNKQNILDYKWKITLADMQKTKFKE